MATISDTATTEELIDHAASILKILGDPVRFRIIGMLAAGELCACKFHEPLGLSQSLASHHLRVLAENGIITGRNVGRNIFYSLNKEQIEIARGVLGAFSKIGEAYDNKSTGAGVC